MDNKPRSRMDAKSKIRVRRATIDDAADIQRLAHELAETVGDTPPVAQTVRARLEDLLETSGARVLVVENERGIVGAVSLWVKPDLAHGDVVIEVPMLVVAHGHRRTGVGRLLMEEVRSVASDHAASQIELVATRTNVVAREFYRSQGFVEADVVSLEFVGSNDNPPDEEQ